MPEPVIPEQHWCCARVATGDVHTQIKSLSMWFGGEQRPAVQVSLQSPFPLLALDHLSHRKFSVQEQIFTHSEACSAGNWPVPRALFPAVGRTHRAPAGARLTCGTGGDGLLD